MARTILSVFFLMYSLLCYAMPLGFRMSMQSHNYKYSPTRVEVSVTAGEKIHFDVLVYDDDVCTIDWGDGSADSYDGAYFADEDGYYMPNHTYSESGVYVVSILSDADIGEWDFGIVSFFDKDDNTSVTRVLEWGDNIGDLIYACSQKSSGYVYSNCANLRSIPADFKNVGNICGAFYGCTKLESIPAWGGVTNAWHAYAGCTGVTSVWKGATLETLMPDSVTSHEGAVTNSSEFLQSLFYPEWGGTRSRDSSSSESNR